jgi:hypothetical protein
MQWAAGGAEASENEKPPFSQMQTPPRADEFTAALHHPISADNAESEKRHQVEQNDTDLEDAHPGIVKRVELVPRQTEPSAMDALHPIVSKDKEQEPDRHNSVIDDRCPQKKVARNFSAHLILLLQEPRAGYFGERNVSTVGLARWLYFSSNRRAETRRILDTFTLLFSDSTQPVLASTLA